MQKVPQAARKNQETHQGNHGVCNRLLWPLVAVKFIEYPMAHNSTLYALKAHQHCWSALRQNKETENKQI